MTLTERVLPDGEGSPVEVESVHEAAFGDEDVAEIVEGRGHSGVIGTERRLAAGESRLVERGRCRVPPEKVVDVCEVLAGKSDGRIVSPRVFSRIARARS